MSEPQSTKGHILLLEAEQEPPSPLTAFLAERGFRMRVAATAETALHDLHEVASDLILLGKGLSGAQAIEFCRRIRNTQARSTLPLIVLSETAEPKAIRELVAAGATDVLVEPFGKDLLLARLELYLEVAAVRNELALRNDLLDREVSDRREVEESVRAAEVTGRELVENLSEVIYTAGPDG
ncbi:MAG: response regulator, partial [Anaerolineae bacterium]|nr:response regulator [Anaerolineae bacterium]